MKRRREAASFLAILFAIAVALESDRTTKEEPERSRMETPVVSRTYYAKTTTNDNLDNGGTGKPRVSLCCRVGTFLTGNDCVVDSNNTSNGTTTRLPIIHEIDLTPSNITASDEHFDFVIWNPCVGRNRYALDPRSYEDEEWYLLANGTILRPFSVELEERLLDYRQYCLARVMKDDYREYLVFFCEEAYPLDDNDGSGEVVYAFGMLASVPFLAATYVVYWLLPDLRNLHGLTLRGYVGCLMMAYSMLGLIQLTPQRQISDDVCIALGIINVAVEERRDPFLFSD